MSADAGGPPPGGAAPQDEKAWRDAVAKAMQSAWNDYCADSGNFPDCFKVRNDGPDGTYMEANFRVGNFARFVADSLAPPDAGRDAGGAPDNERIYPCDKCGKLRSKDEGGTTFTVCDECWDAKAALTGGRPAAEPPDVRAAALREAAAAVCWMCKAGMPFHDRYQGWHIRTDARPGLRTECLANPIWAALGAAPPTQDAGREKLAAHLDKLAESVPDFAKLHAQHTAEQIRGAPAEPGEREGET